jgi:hypothetical protein
MRNTENLVIARANLHLAELYGPAEDVGVWLKVIEILEARLQREQDIEDHELMQDLIAGPMGR